MFKLEDRVVKLCLKNNSFEQSDLATMRGH